MSRLPQIPLQPVAHPVDTFLSPTLSKPTPPSLLAELATSLSTIQPELQQIVDRRGSAFVQGSQMRAKADAARFQFDNVKSFQAAVDAGQIAESDNPWYMVQLKQEVARHEADQAAAQARVAYYNDPIRFNDNPAEVEAFLNKQFAPIVQGRDVWEMDALTPALQQAGKQIVLEHIHNRQDQREQEREVAFQNTASSLIQTLDKDTLDKAAEGDASAVQQVQQVQGAVQNLVDRSRLTVFGPKLNKWLIEATVNTGLERKDARLYQTILSGVKDTDGSALGSGHEARSIMDAADERITDQNRRKVREEHEDQQLEIEKETQQSMGLLQRQVEAMGPNDNLLNLQVPLGTINPQARRNLEVYINGLQNNRKVKLNDLDEEKTKNILQELTNGVTTGTLDDNRKVSLLTALASMGHMPDVLSIASLEDRMRNDKWGPTEPDTEVSLLAKIADETLTPGDVLQKIQEGKLDKADGRFYTMEALRIASGKGHGPMAEENYQNILSSIVFAKAADDSGLDDASKIRDDQSIQQKVTGAKLAFLKDSRQWLIDHPNATSPEREKAFNELIDTTSKKYGGYGYQEWQDKVQGKSQPTFQVKPPTPPGKTPVDPILTPIAERDPILGKLTNEDLWELNRVRTSSADGPDQFKVPTEFHAIDDFDPLARFLGFVDLKKEFPIADEAEQTRIESLWQNTLLRKQAIRFAIVNQNVVDRLKSQLSTTRTQVNISADDKRRVLVMDNLLKEYATIGQLAGYSVPEVKSMPPGSWAKVRMFANDRDLAKRGQAVAAELGLSTSQEGGAFLSAQREFVK